MVEAKYRQSEKLWEEGKREESLALLRSCAEAGYAEAQYRMGEYLFLEANDAPAAVVWYCRAVAQGHRRAGDALHSLLEAYPHLVGRAGEFLPPHRMDRLGIGVPRFLDKLKLWMVRLISLVMFGAFVACAYHFWLGVDSCINGESYWRAMAMPLFFLDLGMCFFGGFSFAYFRMSWLKDDNAGSHPLLILIGTAFWVQVALVGLFYGGRGCLRCLAVDAPVMLKLKGLLIPCGSLFVGFLVLICMLRHFLPWLLALLKKRQAR